MIVAKTLAVAIILIGLFVIRLMKYRAKWKGWTK